jgi:hypothetical protein
MIPHRPFVGMTPAQSILAALRGLSHDEAIRVLGEALTVLVVERQAAAHEKPVCSATPPGVAQALADQWGGYVETQNEERA